MTQEVIELNADKQKTLKDLFQKDMAATMNGNRTRAADPAPMAAGQESVAEGLAVGDHTPVSNRTEQRAVEDGARGAFGKKGPPQVPNHLEVQVAIGSSSANRESFEEAMADFGESHLLDAWHAEYSPLATLSALRQERANNAMMEAVAEVVIGRDDRVRVTNGLTNSYPWRCICSLRIVANDGSPWIGTGWLVGPRTVITAGHCVYIHTRGGWVQNIEVIPGRDGTEDAAEPCVATSFRSVSGWTQGRLRTRDYGAILLPEECRYGNDLGRFGYSHQEDAALLASAVNLAGYPGDKMPPGSQQWFHAREVLRLDSSVMFYEIDTAGGQSGGPVWWLMEDDSRIAVGIHTNGDLAGNSATRITEAVAANIRDWAAEGE